MGWERPRERGEGFGVRECGGETWEWKQYMKPSFLVPCAIPSCSASTQLAAYSA